MAKASYTKNGNIKVTMTEEQYVAIRALLDKVVLGNDNVMTSAVSDLCVDLGDRGFEYDAGIDHWISETCDNLHFQLESDRGEYYWSIAFK